MLAHYGYTYDSASNVSTHTDTSDQLTSESRGNGHGMGYALAYTYDHNHNRHTKVVGTGMSAVTDTYSYDAHDKLTGISGGTNKSYGYDSNGNCTSVTVGTSVTSVSYDVENCIARTLSRTSSVHKGSKVTDVAQTSFWQTRTSNLSRTGLKPYTGYNESL